MKRKQHVWIVERHNTQTGQWESTVGAVLSRDDAGVELADWQYKNPDDYFRIAMYERKKP